MPGLTSAAAYRGVPTVISNVPEIFYVSDGAQLAARADGEAAAIPFERCEPVRNFAAWKGKRNYAGAYWTATNPGHVGFESLFERTNLMLLDFAADTTHLCSQPMWIVWPKGSRPSSHAPDYFARLRNGDGLLVDVRPASRIDEDVERTFSATAELCAAIGWKYSVMSEPDPVVASNVSLLSAYSRPWMGVPDADLEAILSVFSVPRPLDAACDRLEQIGFMPALPLIYNLLWRHLLSTNLAVVLSKSSLVWAERKIA